MKKIMIAVALVCAAVMSQAATANWKMAASGIMNGTGSKGASYLWSGSAYIFDASKADQQALFEAFAKDTAKFDITAQAGYITTGVVDSKGAINNSVAANNFSYGERSTAETTVKQSFFFVLIDDKKMYTSIDSSSLSASGTDAAVNILMGAQADGSSVLAAEGWQGTAKWSVAGVPEPTSGLLVMLGVGLMALRRRRA